MNTSASIIVVEVVALTFDIEPTIIVAIWTIVVLVTIIVDIPVTLCESSVIELICDFTAVHLSTISTIHSGTGLPIEQIPVLANILPASFHFTHNCIVVDTIDGKHTTILSLSNIDTVLTKVIVEAFDFLDAGQALAVDIVGKAAVFVDPAFLQDIDQGEGIGNLCVGIAEVTACISGVSRITVGINTKDCLALRLLCEAIEAACTHVDLVADVAGGHCVNLGNILPDAFLGSQLQALNQAQGICGSLINNLALLDPAHGHSQRVGGLVKLQRLHLEVFVDDIQLAVIHNKAIIKVNGCLNPGQIADTLCQAQQHCPGIGAFHSATGQHIGQFAQAFGDRNGGHIHCEGVGSDHILGRIDNVIDIAVFNLGVAYLTVPCQHAVAAGGLVKVEVVFALLIQHDIDGCLCIFVQSCSDGQRLYGRFCCHESKAIHGTCFGYAQSEGYIVSVDGNGLAFKTCLQRQLHAGAIDCVHLGLFKVQLIGVGDGHQLGANYLAIQHQIYINLAQTLAGKDTVFGDLTPSFIADCPGSTLRHINCIASGADTGSSHLNCSADGCIIVLALNHSMVKLGGAGSGGVDQQVGRNVTGIAVGRTVHNSQIIGARLTSHEGSGAAAVQVDSNHTAGFLHDVANVLQACAGGEGGLTTVDTHNNHTTGGSDTDRSTGSIRISCVAYNLAILNNEFTEATDSFLDLAGCHHALILIMSTHVSSTVVQDCKEACGIGLGIPFHTVHNEQTAGSCNVGHIVAACVGGHDNIEVLNVVLACRIAVTVLSILCGAGNRVILPDRVLRGAGFTAVVVDPQTHILTVYVSRCHIVNNLLAIGIGCVVDLLGNTGSQNLGLGVKDGETGVSQVFHVVTGVTAHLICKGIADCLAQFSQLVTGRNKVTGAFQSCDQLIAGVSIVHSSTQILTGAQTIQAVIQQVVETSSQSQTGLVVFTNQLCQITGLVTLGNQLVHEVVTIQVSIQVDTTEGTGRTCNIFLEQILLGDECDLFFQR